VTQALYRKWRSQSFDEVVGQDHVVRTLTGALAQNRIGHAYLFAGPRGTGKTTMARLLAKAVNCLAEDVPRPCNQCAMCQSLNEGRLLDLIEIDGASNRGIDEVRTLREQVNFSPNVARYKVYIIDEVHMLTTEAFNALLKTLEEPPSHVIFVLATTESHKLPPTIISRCQRFDFRRIPLDLIAGHLKRIAESEGLKAEPSALELIGRSATGSMRDAISLLDQLSAYGSESITRELVQSMLGAVSTEPLAELIDLVIQKDLKSALGLVGQLVDQGLDPRQLTGELLDYARDLLQVKAGNPPSLTAATAQTEKKMRAQAKALGVEDILRISRLLTQAILDIKGNVLSQLPLELAVAEAILKPEPAQPKPAQTEPAPRPAVRQSPPPEPAKTATTRKQEAVQQSRSEPEPVQVPATTPAAGGEPGIVDLGLLRSRWTDIVDNLRNYNPRTQSLSAQALLRSGVPMEVRGDTIVIGFPSEFHKKKIGEDAPKALVEKAIADTLGVATCTLRGVVVSQQELKAAAEASLPQKTYAQAAKPDTALAEGIDDPLVEYAANDLGAVVKRISPEEPSSTGQEGSS
jgi:DNA polymerase-3 subunit gamma/tau